MLTLCEARQAPGLSALVTHTHTHANSYTETRWPFTGDLSEAAIFPSGGMCTLLVRERDMEVGALMNNAAANEMGDDGDRDTSIQRPEAVCVCV